MNELNEVVKDSPIPVFYQIYVDLKKRLLGNMLQDDDHKLPSERELAQLYNVSRVTMRQSLAELEKDGIITRQRGRGSFVNSTPKPILHSLDLPPNTGERSVRNCVDKNPEILEMRYFEKTDPQIGEALDYQGPIYYIKRIFRVDGNPVAINRIWLPATFTPDLDKTGLIDGSLSKTLSGHYGIKVCRRTNIIEAVRPSSSDVDILKITFDTLILQISSTSYTTGDVPYEHSRTSWIGDAIRLKVEIEDIEHGLEFSAQ